MNAHAPGAYFSPGNTATAKTRGSLGINILSIALVVVALGLAGVQFVPQIRYSVIYALGRSPLCSYSEALDSLQVREGLAKILAEITKSSRIAEKDQDGFWLWETPQGNFWAPGDDDETLLFNLAEQEAETYSTRENAVQPGDIVLDCGAHVGTFTRVALEAGASLVVAVEPSPRTVVALKRNFEEEIAAGRVLVSANGVWDTEGVLPFVLDPAAGGTRNYVAPEAELGERVVKVPLTTVDRLVKELELDRVDFIKMDIEGSEQRALLGARETLAKFRPRLAIAAYHVHDDQTGIPENVFGARPDYKMKYNVCSEKHDFSIGPVTLLFY